MFIQYDPNSVMNQNYSHLVQQRPGNNIVPAMQPSSSFYSASAGEHVIHSGLAHIIHGCKNCTYAF